MSAALPARVGAIVLAAGQSTRLGRPKQLLPLSGRPMLERTLDVVWRAKITPAIVVIGGYADDILRDVDTDEFTVITNPDYAGGQSTSLRAGLAALPPEADGALVVLGDQPLVPPWLLEQLVAAFDPAQHVAVRPRYVDGPGNPVLLSRELFTELAQLSGDVGARDVLQRHRERVLDLPVPGRNAPRDVDTQADYEALLLEWASTGAPDIPRYCQRCANEVELAIRYDRLRPVCANCGFTYFYDPKLAVTTVVEIAGQIVLQRRAIDPGRGKWTFPGGFVDRGEVLHEAAIREVQEEVGLTIHDPQLIGAYSLPGDWVILIAYHASADGQTPSIGDESSDVQLFHPDNLPELAFPRDPLVLRDLERVRAG